MITINNSKIVLETSKTCYVMKVNTKGELMNLYYGKKIFHAEELDEPVTDDVLSDHIRLFKYNPEFPTRKRGYYDEPCLSARFSDGINDLDLVYEKAEKTSTDALKITLKDRHYKLKVYLYYTVFYDFNLIDKHAVVENCGEDDVALENFLSGAVTLPPSEKYVLLRQWGYWSNEYRKEESEIPHAKTVIQNRRGICSGPQQTPFYATRKERHRNAGQSMVRIFAL